MTARLKQTKYFAEYLEKDPDIIRNTQAKKTAAPSKVAAAS